MFENIFRLQNTVGANSLSASTDAVSAPADTAGVVEQTVETLPIIDLIIDSWTVMLPLFVLSIVAIYIWVERFSAIQKASKIDGSFMTTLKGHVSQGKIQEAKDLCKQYDTPVARMMGKGIARLGRPLKEISSSIENVGRLEVADLEKNLSILATISGAAPMIGFLGTVIGMMNTFHQMANGGNSGIEIGDLSSGIMYAMTTTVAGLVVGIIAYLGYNLLVAKVDKVVHDMEDKSVEFMDLLNEPAA